MASCSIYSFIYGFFCIILPLNDSLMFLCVAVVHYFSILNSFPLYEIFIIETIINNTDMNNVFWAYLLCIISLVLLSVLSVCFALYIIV